MRWIAGIPVSVRGCDLLRPGSPAARGGEFRIAIPHGRRSIARAPRVPSESVFVPQVVLAGVAISIAISFNIMLPVVPVLTERAGPHGAAGAATAALFAGAVAGELF